MIERSGAGYPSGRSKSTRYKDLVWAVATAVDEGLDLVAQTTQTLASIDDSLAEFGTDKTRIVSAQVYLANIDDKPVMDEVWNNWIGEDPDNWPQRACLGVNLGGHWLIEVTVTAATDLSPITRR